MAHSQLIMIGDRLRLVENSPRAYFRFTKICMALIGLKPSGDTQSSPSGSRHLHRVRSEHTEGG